MASPLARDQSARRRWTRTPDNGTYMFSVRIPEPLLTEFRQYCERTGMTPSDVMRCALRVYMDDRVRRKAKRRIAEHERKI